MTSFSLQECIHYNTERGSPVFVCFLDSATAFDTVWHTGLFVKLHRLGIRGKLWSLLINAYTNMKNCVLQNGVRSEWIDVRQSVRQGSVLGPWNFLVHIDGLPKAIQSSGHGAYVNDIFCGCPLQADDVALVSVSEQSLQSMIDICADYARKWRFTFNASKTKIMVFGNSKIKTQKLTNRRAWTLGENVLDIVDSYTHVGIKLDRSESSLSRTTEACAKSRRTFAAACGLGINPMSPRSAS